MAGQLVASFLSRCHMGQFAHLSTGPQVLGASPPHLLLGTAGRCPLPLTWGPGLFSGSQQGLLTSPSSFFLAPAPAQRPHPGSHQLTLAGVLLTVQNRLAFSLALRMG